MTLGLLKGGTYTGLETFPAPPGHGTTEHRTKEVRTVCPYTGQPDFYDLRIRCWSGKRCVESKSLKYYLAALTERPTSGERLAATIAADVQKATGSLVEVRLRQAARGGIAMTHRASAGYR